jgi:hypothetical protein
MLAVHVWSHKDGDNLVIVNTPWWTNLYVFCLERFCPCCGVSGFLSEHLLSEKAFDWLYSHWSSMLFWVDKKEKELYRTSIAHSCEASEAIFGKDAIGCWHELGGE